MNPDKPRWIWIVVLSALSGALSGLVVGLIVAERSSSGAVTAFATLALAVLTGLYVVELRRQSDTQASRWALDRQAQETRWVAEGKEQAARWDAEREQERRDRLRQRSEEAAQVALARIWESGIRPGSPFDRGLALDVFHALEQRAPFLVDDDVKERMKIAGVLLWMSHWDDRALVERNVSRDSLEERAAFAAERCAEALQNYLTNESLPEWLDLPASYGSAVGWVVNRCAIVPPTT